MYANVAARRDAVKYFLRGQAWVAQPDAENPRLAVVSPGPPGVGKSHAALYNLLYERAGQLLEPTHAQAQERLHEARQLEHQVRSTTPPPDADPEVAALYEIGAVGRPSDVDDRGYLKRPQHIEGLGRCCFYLPRDEWQARGWPFGKVVCPGCPRRAECLAKTQFWREPLVTLGVHPMAEWGGTGPLVLDELPQPVKTTIVDMEELVRLAAPVWPQAIEEWRRPIEGDWRALMNELRYIAETVPTPQPWGTTVQLAGLWPLDHPIRHYLTRILNYLELHPVPPPDPAQVRAGAIKPTSWPSQELLLLLETLQQELDVVSIQQREVAGIVRTLCVRAFGDTKGQVVRVQVELRERWRPPSSALVMLASLGRDNAPVIERLFAHHEIKHLTKEVPLPTEGIELYHYDTHALARKRTLTIGNQLTPRGAHALARALRKVAHQGRRVRDRVRGRPLLGLILHKVHLEALGYDPPTGDVVETRDWTGRTRAAKTELLEAAVRELEQQFDLVWGYHGAVIGSNRFKDVQLLAVLADPSGHIGALQEEARTLRLDAQWYVEWKVRTTATQEVYRARLLDASPSNPKIIMYIGTLPPDLGLPWTPQPWAAGGQLPSLTSHLLEGAMIEMSGTRQRPLLAAPHPEFAGLHATVIESLLYALREAHVNIEELSPRDREQVRRAAAAAATFTGLQLFERPHPLGDRRPLTIWAVSAADADTAVAEIRAALQLLPRPQQRVLRAHAPQRDTTARRAAQLAVRLDRLREAVAVALLGRQEACARAANPEARRAARAHHNRRLRRLLDTWQAMRPQWLRPRPCPGGTALLEGPR